MDVYQTEMAASVSGMPKEVVDQIWTHGGNKEYVKKAIEAAKRDDR